MNEKMNENVKPLKWHKFMIYFALWVVAILTLGYSVAFFTGSIYGEIGKNFYQVLPVMQWVDIAYAVALLAFSGYQIYTRFQLAGFKKGAPRKLLMLYAAGFIVNLAYILCFATIMTRFFINLGYPDVAEKVWYLVGRSLWDLLPTVIMFQVNKVYYGKRKELFVN